MSNYRVSKKVAKKQLRTGEELTAKYKMYEEEDLDTGNGILVMVFILAKTNIKRSYIRSVGNSCTVL